MSEMVATNNQTDLIQFDEEKVALIKRTIAPTATDDELALFLHQCKRTGLDPLARQIYFQKYDTKRGPKVSIITGIDGYRLVADRTGVYAGSDEPDFEGSITQQRYNDTKKVPAKASVTVWKIVGGKRVPFTASAYWNEYYPGDKKGHMWFKMPHVMLGKVAEAAALRKAFPADLSGVYTREEMDQAEWTETVEVDGESDHEPTEEPQPEPEAPADDNGSKFWATAHQRIPYFNAPKHAEHAAGLLGLGYPQTKDEAAAALMVLEQYASLRADGVEQDEAVFQTMGGGADEEE